jgi:hypothetical protein
VGPHTIRLRLAFDRPVLAIEVAIAGYEARYVGEDHHVRELEVSLSASVGGSFEGTFEAPIVATLNLQDDSGNSFTGWIDYLAFVELAPRPFDPRDGVGPISDNPIFEG